METEFVRECKRKMKLILKSKLNAKNKIEAINPQAAAILKHGAGILEWRVDELKKQIGRLGNSSQCIKGSNQRVMQKDFTKVEKKT